MDWLTQRWAVTIELDGLWLVLLVLAAIAAAVVPAIVVGMVVRRRFDRADRVTAAFGDLIAGMPVGVVYARPDGRVAAVNARARELWPELRPGAPLPDAVARLPAGDGGTTSGVVGGPDGTRLIARVQRPAGPRGREWLVTLDDASRLQQEAEFASTLVRQISHELKTPLSVIRGYASRFAVDGRAGADEVRRAWAVVDDEASRLTGLIDQAILMARLETAEPVFERRPFNLRALCEEVVIDLADRAALDEVEMELEVAPGQYIVNGDRPALRQVVLNLVDNAIKYGGPGVRVVIALDASPETGQIRLSVTDNGPGIAAADVPMVFEKGYRGAGARGSRAGGGLGLALVRSIVEWHGGTVAVERGPQAGARVVVQLPEARP